MTYTYSLKAGAESFINSDLFQILIPGVLFSISMGIVFCYIIPGLM